MLTNLRLQNFRSYKDESYEFEPGVNIIVGPNASGKTNLLEAILVLARGSSYRTRDLELVRFGAPWAKLTGFFEKHQRIAKLEKTGETIKKTFELDDNSLHRLSLEREIPIVFFEPEHLQTLTSGPDARREFLDELIVRVRPGYKSTLSGYRRTLAQRNALLKRGQTYGEHQLFAWNVRLGELGQQIVLARLELIEDINKNLSKVYGRIANKRSRARLEYATKFPPSSYASRLVSQLEKDTKLDFERGFTAHGPHREDVLIYLNEHPIDQTASRGETRSLLLALKKLELEIIETARHQKPILLLDDVFSELDGSRRQALVEMVGNYQTVLTTTDADTALAYFSRQNLLAIGKKP